MAKKIKRGRIILANAELIENKKSVPFEFNNVAKNYDLATFLSQGYQKDLQLSASRMNLNEMNISPISAVERENRLKHV